MAPLSLGDKLNLYSMIGTWVGTLFTLVGLIAVVAQLRALLRGFSNSRDEVVKAAAGDWAICLPKLGRMDTGVIGGKAPSLRAWIHYQYNEGKDIVVCPYQRKSMSGQSSWSQLFCRLQILPEDLLNPGHQDNHPVAAPQVPTTADIHVDGSKISYGLPAEDFAALLILAGFSPSHFDPKETTKKTSHLGHMYVAPHSDPFTQIAQLDGATWNTFNTFPGAMWQGRYSDRLNVRHCIDLALGILRFDCAGKPSTLLYCHADRGFVSNTSWTTVQIRRNLTELTGGSMDENPIYDVTSAASPDFVQLFGSRCPGMKGLRFEIIFPPEGDEIFRIAFGLKALKPWGLLPVIPESVVSTFYPHLQKVFAKESPSSILILTQKFRELPATTYFNIPHRTRATMDSSLASLSDVETHSFSGLSARCSLYYDAMIFVFESHNLKLADVETALAARCATNLAVKTGGLFQKIYNESYQQVKPQQWKVQFSAFMRECLNGEPVDDVEPWACEILAVYLHAWLRAAKDLKGDFRGNFRRRVFLG
ncbi:uncharacterized protein BP5553_06597 [Venustampulla echinocandica]|uniref:Uncharacterized protein n=1 Tax=Venustampulla echinocandica TaxID=2656787 RepID=A0A370TKE5_9HELO|nr:uncharacterized protein BP5553_06597 [Venustampulla echinocandica]RDL35985.1 hypothetical protein BP5553_06597 [Venustampulla echinocandica]